MYYIPPVSFFFPWLVVLLYLVPIVGTLVTMRRRVGQIWSLGESLRNLLPDDRVYRRIRGWEERYRSWKVRHPIASYINQDLLNLAAGKIEYAFGHFRDYTIGLAMMGGAVFDLTLMVIGDPWLRSERFFSLFYHGAFALLSLWTYQRHVATGLQMTEFMRVNPHVHPQEFFDHYYRRLGPAAVPVPLRATRTVDPTDISYLTGQRPRIFLWPLLHAVYDTAIFARSALKALTIGSNYGREVFDGMASLWGSRILQLFQARLVVKGIEKFYSLPGKVILIFNHKSHLDFALNFFALSSARLANGRNIRPRYLAAKDHLVDNKLIYSGLGVGQLIENCDMVFVDRKGKGKDSIREACEKLVEKEIEIAMYPQGTRAIANRGARGERLDAGYYTTGSAHSLKRRLGHLKKGCAYLALDTVAALKERGKTVPVHLVPIGIDGTATLIPKGAFRIQTEGTVRFTVGEAITLDASDLAGQSIDRLQETINQGLVRALHLHERLKDRFLEEVKDANLLILNHRLTQADRDGDPIPFEILDRIYALPVEEQKVFRSDLARRLASGEELTILRDKVTDQLFRHRGKEMKTIVRQEEAVRRD